jgi:glycosyl transferase family 25
MNFDYILTQPAFVIHIEEYCANRTEFFKKNIKNAGYTNMQIFEGVKAKNKNELDSCINEFNNIKLHEHLGFGQMGCLLSHLKLYKHIVKNNISICTIFEDDVFFHPDWKKLSHMYYNYTPKNFDIIFIGNQINECANINKVPNINTLSTYCTHAYIITIEGAKKLLTYLLNWDYNTIDVQKYVGHPLTGLFCIDIMIKNIQERMNKKKLKKNINWYCWNGTRYPCDYNILPLKGMRVRNTGLVFQSDKFESLVTQYKKENFTDEEDIILPCSSIHIFLAKCDDLDITEKLINIIKLFENSKEQVIITKEHLNKYNISLNFKVITISYKYDT